MSKKRSKTGAFGRLRSQQSVNNLIRQGKRAFGKHDYDQAISVWQAARQDKDLPGDVCSRLDAALAEAHFRRGQRDLMRRQKQALDDLAQAANLQPGDALYAYHLGLAQHRCGYYTEAIKSYEEALKRDANFSRVYYPLTLAMAQNGQDPGQTQGWPALSETERQLLRQTPPDDDLVAQGLAAIQRGDWTDAQLSLTESLQTSNQTTLSNGLAYYYLGVIAAREDDTEQAITYWRQAFDAGLKSPALADNLSLAYTLRAEAALVAGDFDTAVDAAAGGLEIAPDHPRLPDIMAHARLARGYLRAEAGDWEAAADEWTRVENASGAVARDLAANVAIAYEKMDWLGEAAESWREFARRRPRKGGSEGWLPPEQVAKLWARVSGLYAQAGLPDEAISTLQTALKHQPDDITLGLALVRSYIGNEQYEAAHNQVDRMLAKAPQHVETLVLKAQITEAAPRGWYFRGDVAGIPEWEKVLDTGDETYAPVARQRLGELYIEAIGNNMRWYNFSGARAIAKQGLKRLPENHELRAEYISVLLIDDAKKKLIDEQLALLDLTDWEALHRLVDVLHILNKHHDAGKMLKEADALKPLDTDFYLGIANCAMGRDQEKLAEGYFKDALDRAENEEMRKRTRHNIGLIYMSNGYADTAEEIWQSILQEDAAFGPTHLVFALMEFERGKKRASDRHMKQAEKWAKEHPDHHLGEAIEHYREMMKNPFMRAFGGGPFGSVPSPAEMAAMLDDFMDDDFYDDDDFFFDDEPRQFTRKRTRGRGRQGRDRK